MHFPVGPDLGRAGLNYRLYSALIKTIAVFQESFPRKGAKPQRRRLGEVKVSPDDKSSLFGVKMLMRITSWLCGLGSLRAPAVS